MTDELDARVRYLNAERARPWRAAPGALKGTEPLGQLMHRLIDTLAKAMLGPDPARWEDE